MEGLTEHEVGESVRRLHTQTSSTCTGQRLQERSTHFLWFVSTVVHTIVVVQGVIFVRFSRIQGHCTPNVGAGSRDIGADMCSGWDQGWQVVVVVDGRHSRGSRRQA
jgi:hypothetical protein